MIPTRAPNHGTYFVTSSTWEQREIFRADPLAKLLVETLLQYRDEGQFLLHEFVVMPNHVHLILTPLGIALERAMQYIKGGYSHRVKVEMNSKVNLWQRGFTDHRIRDAEDYESHRAYIHLNPVKARLVEAPEQYPWSSATGKWQLDDVPQRLKPLVREATLRHDFSRALTNGIARVESRA